METNITSIFRHWLLIGLCFGAVVAGKAEAKSISFPQGFKWCVATAAHQIEGNNTESDWWDWEQQRVCDETGCRCRVKNCESSGPATDHWNRVDEDIALLKDLGVQQYRFSVEWAKIEPRQGEYDWSAVEHYRNEVRSLQAAGIEPMITLHHFTMPRWLRALGGWEWSGTPDAFAGFATFVYREIGTGVRDWVTVNEPLVHIGGGYVLGVTPPGLQAAPNTEADYRGAEARSFSQRQETASDVLEGGSPTPESMKRMVAPLKGLLRSHAKAYRALHAAAKASGSPVRVGFAHHLRVFDPTLWWSPLDWIVTGIVEELWNWSFPNAVNTGRLVMNVPFMLNVDEEIPGLAGTQDFFGLNYYSRDLVGINFENGFALKIEVKKDSNKNDMGWEIYPKGLYRTLWAVHHRFDLPILITENGTADAGDAFRPDFLRKHLAYLGRAISEGVRVENYCHWSLLDNFEWVEGFGPRFGLYEVDYSTQQRIKRPSAHFFGSVARYNGFEY